MCISPSQGDKLVVNFKTCLAKLYFTGLYTYCLRDGDYFVVEKKHAGECGNSPHCADKSSPEKKKQKTSWKRNIFLDTVI